MRGEELLFDAITGVREELVEEAQRYAFSPRTPWRRYAGLAACLLLAILVGFYSLLGGPHGSSIGGTDSSPSSNTSPQDPADGSSGGTSGAPEPSEVVFTALVLEVSPDRLLVEPDAFCGAKQLEVPVAGVADLPELQAGDRIRVACSGCTLTADPPIAVGVTEIALLPYSEPG